MNRVVVMGEESTGFVIGTLLAAKGMDVTFVVEDEYHRYSLEKNGLYLFGCGYDLTVELSCVADASRLTGVYDVLIFSSSVIEGVHEISFVLEHLHPDSAVLCCQRGIIEDVLQDILGHQTVISMECGVETRSHAPGNLEIIAMKESLIGLWKGDQHLLESCELLLGTVIPVRVHHSVIRAMYSSLIFGACLDALCAISGLPYAALMRKRRFRGLIIGVMSEAVQVADALGILIEPYRRFFNYYSFLKGDNTVARLNRNMVLFLLSFAFEERISRQLRAILDGKKGDVDALNGFISRCAQRTGVITPLNDLLTAMVKDIEARHRHIGVENFEEEFFYFYG
ncbi:MAG: hypothetical protein JXB03_04720 [Spirochaetales bacterium]|nr:hypothetical protein [Spirochaetales bacterium]